jgi:mRNA-degrading endonuclease toxin of MazEF toxin-antitoxin module
MFKDFINWIQYKIYLNARPKYPKFKEGEIWWCSIGVNIGSETVSFALISQLKTVDSKRSQDRIGKISDTELNQIRKKVINFLQ